MMDGYPPESFDAARPAEEKRPGETRRRPDVATGGYIAGPAYVAAFVEYAKKTDALVVLAGRAMERERRLWVCVYLLTGAFAVLAFAVLAIGVFG